MTPAVDTVRVAVAHPAPFVREAIARVCQRDGFVVTATVESGAELVQHCREHNPEVVVVDAALEDGPVERRFGELLGSGARVVVLCDDRSPERYTVLLEAGASGVLQADSPSEHLHTAIRAVAAGAAFLHPTVAETVLGQWRRLRAEVSGNPARAAGLTNREVEVLGAMTDGLANKAIARRLGITIKTVENHKTRIFDKLGVRTRAQAVSLAISQGLLAPALTSDPPPAPEVRTGAPGEAPSGGVPDAARPPVAPPVARSGAPSGAPLGAPSGMPASPG
jgi:DNA-binding NarL/FixJ family response regulator